MSKVLLIIASVCAFLFVGFILWALCKASSMHDDYEGDTK